MHCLLQLQENQTWKRSLCPDDYDYVWAHEEETMNFSRVTISSQMLNLASMSQTHCLKGKTILMIHIARYIWKKNLFHVLKVTEYITAR